MRYYLHGDVLEGESDNFYCARCDSYVPSEHFSVNGVHREFDHGECFLVALARWSNLPEAERSGRVRPESSSNLFRASAELARAKREASRSEFHRWLSEQVKRDDPVGDLAQDVMIDDGFPTGINSAAEMERHLSRHGEHVVRAVRRAWREFEAK